MARYSITFLNYIHCFVQSLISIYLYNTSKNFCVLPMGTVSKHHNKDRAIQANVCDTTYFYFNAILDEIFVTILVDICLFYCLVNLLEIYCGVQKFVLLNILYFVYFVHLCNINDFPCSLQLLYFFINFCAGMFDKDNSGKIDLQEFQALWTYINQWRGVYEQFDRDRSGVINANELCSGKLFFL